MIELNKIYNEDCLLTLSKIDDDTIDLIVTSPPYNIGIDYDVYDDNMSWKNYLDWTNQWLSECFRVLKPDGRICINHYINFMDSQNKISRFPLMDIRNLQENIGFNVHKLIVWDDITRRKQTAWGSWLSASAPYINTPYEGILISYKHQWKKTSKGKSTINKKDFMEGVGGVWNIGTVRGKTKACFPERLPELCINLLTYEGDLVYDPFSGSGTTPYVAKKLNRIYIGSEISEEYCKIANKRLNI